MVVDFRSTDRRVYTACARERNQRRRTDRHLHGPLNAARADRGSAGSYAARGKHMRLRGPLAATGVLGLAVLAVGSIAVLTSINRADALTKTLLPRTIRVNSVVTFAPPPSDASPALTAAEALRESEGGAFPGWSKIPAGLTVKLGLLTLLVGPYCGAECHSLIVKNGLAYQDWKKLAYGYSSGPGLCIYLGPYQPARPGRCISWEFVDAMTGQMIIGTQQKVRPGARG